MLIFDEQFAQHQAGSENSQVGVVSRARLLAKLLFDEAEQGDAEAAITTAAWSALRRSGLLLSVFPRAFGGDDLLAPDRTRDLFAVLRNVGGGDLSVARIFEGHVNGIALVSLYGDGDQPARLADLVRDGALSGVWNAEGRRPLTATRESDGWMLDGEKILASGAGFVTHPVITPKTSDAVIMVVPELGRGERCDILSWTAQGMRATATGTVDFHGLRVPFSAQVGGPGDYMRQPAFSGGAWRFCAVHLGAAERLLDLFRAHLVTRGRDGDPFQQQRVATCTTALKTATFWIDRAAAMVAAERGPSDEVVAFVNLTRMVTERAALDVLEAVHRGVGLGAFMRPHPIERISRDLATYLRQPVPDAAMIDAARVVLASGKASADLWDF